MTAVSFAANPAHAAFACPAFALPCHPTSAVISDTAPPMPQTQRPDATATWEFRALIVAAMRERRAMLIDRAKEAKANRQRKAGWTYEAEIAALTNGLLLMEARND